MVTEGHVEVAGLRYDVVITNNLSLGKDYVGEIDYENLEIRLREVAPEKMRQTFCHELVHAIMASIGEMEHDEKFVEAFSQGLYAVLKHNPDFIAKISGAD